MRRGTSENTHDRNGKGTNYPRTECQQSLNSTPSSYFEMSKMNTSQSFLLRESPGTCFRWSVSQEGSYLFSSLSLRLPLPVPVFDSTRVSYCFRVSFCVNNQNLLWKRKDLWERFCIKPSTFRRVTTSPLSEELTAWDKGKEKERELRCPSRRRREIVLGFHAWHVDNIYKILNWYQLRYWRQKKKESPPRNGCSVSESAR